MVAAAVLLVGVLFSANTTTELRGGGASPPPFAVGGRGSGGLHCSSISIAFRQANGTGAPDGAVGSGPFGECAGPRWTGVGVSTTLGASSRQLTLFRQRCSGLTVRVALLPCP